VYAELAAVLHTPSVFLVMRSSIVTRSMIVSVASNDTLFPPKLSTFAAICVFAVQHAGSASARLAITFPLSVALIALDIATHSLQQRIEPDSSISILTQTAICRTYEQTIAVGIVDHRKHRHAVHVCCRNISASTQLTDEAGHHMQAPASPLSKRTKDHVVSVR